MDKTHEQEKGYKYPSVTTILSVLRKPALENWYKVNTAEFCDTESKRAKEIGTAIHDAICHHINRTGIDTETNYPTEVGICIQSFVKFKTENPSIKLKSSEMVIESKKYKYNGTLDCLAFMDGLPVILDWKTNKKKLTIYDEHYYQLSAYIRAYEEMAKCKIKKGIIVEIGKDEVGYNLGILEGKKLGVAFKIFRRCLDIYNLQKKFKGVS